MQNILVIESSPRGEASYSRKLTHAIVEKLQKKNSDAAVKVTDLAKNPFPHLEEAHLAAFFGNPEKYTATDKEAIRHSNAAIAEIMNAEVIVIGVPMYNFSIPSGLKAWIDHVVRAGHTFKYSASGPEGLVKGKKVYLGISSGGVYSEGPMKAFDFTESYLKTILGFLGMTDVTTFRVEGTAIPGTQEQALNKAVKSIDIE